jgi:signal transduction histidine kinase
VIARAVVEARPIFLGSLEEYAHRYPASYERGRAARIPEAKAYAALPLSGDGTPVGAISFVYDHEREFDGAERSFKEIVARHCGLAFERVELLEAEQRARAESELLYSLTSEVALADDVEAVYAIALDAVKRGTRADRTAILLFDDDNVMRFKAWRGISDSYRAAVEGHTPWQRDEAQPTPVTVDDTELDPAWASYREVFRAEGIRALAFIPLTSRKRLIGKFMIYRDQPQAFTARELQLAGTVAFHIGESLARKADAAALARAYAEEKEAHAAAEEATRAREEIISVVSHDLRNPLGTILLGAGALLQNESVAAVAGSIHRQAQRMARLIEDLVDFAGIQAGKLALDRVDHAPTEIIHAATDLFGPLAQERGLLLESTVQPDLPPIRCDSGRALQVLANLMSNALKVTPKGGQVKIGVEARSSDVVFFVNDTGPGISATELPQIFERYWRGKTSQYRGAGLGLSIARGIVDAHGGKIWAESTVGVGSTFYFSLT